MVLFLYLSGGDYLLICITARHSQFAVAPPIQYAQFTSPLDGEYMAAVHPEDNFQTKPTNGLFICV